MWVWLKLKLTPKGDYTKIDIYIIVRDLNKC